MCTSCAPRGARFLRPRATAFAGATRLRGTLRTFVCATFCICSAHSVPEAMERNKRERFVDLGEARVRKATQMLRLIGNLSNTSNYEYTQEDAQKILAALDGELKLLRAKFQAALARRAKDDFRLG